MVLLKRTCTLSINNVHVHCKFMLHANSQVEAQILFDMHAKPNTLDH